MVEGGERERDRKMKGTKNCFLSIIFYIHMNCAPVLRCRGVYCDPEGGG